MENQNLLNEPLLQLGATSFTLGDILLAGIVVLVVVAMFFLNWIFQGLAGFFG